MHRRDGVIVVRKKKNYIKHVNVILIPFQQLTSSAGWASKREKRWRKKNKQSQGTLFWSGVHIIFLFYFSFNGMQCVKAAGRRRSNYLRHLAGRFSRVFPFYEDCRD